MDIGDLLISDSASTSLLCIITLMIGAVLLDVLASARQDTAKPEADPRDMTPFSIVLLSAVLLAIFLFRAAEKDVALRNAIALEASAMMNIARDANAMPDPLRSIILDDAERYQEQVIQGDWPALIAAQHHPLQEDQTRPASLTLTRLWSDSADAQLSMNAATDNLMANLATLNTSRTRRFALAAEGMSNASWLVVLCALGATIHLAKPQRSERIRDRLPRLLLHACLMGLVLWLLAELDHPFSGTLTTRPAPLVQALETIRQLKAGPG
jgi:type II secretory pathway pseudopilin PulG